MPRIVVVETPSTLPEPTNREDGSAGGSWGAAETDNGDTGGGGDGENVGSGVHADETIKVVV
jgi:hypothetical protein